MGLRSILRLLALYAGNQRLDSRRYASICQCIADRLASALEFCAFRQLHGSGDTLGIPSRIGEIGMERRRGTIAFAGRYASTFCLCILSTQRISAARIMARMHRPAAFLVQEGVHERWSRRVDQWR